MAIPKTVDECMGMKCKNCDWYKQHDVEVWEDTVTGCEKLRDLRRIENSC